MSTQTLSVPDAVMERVHAELCKAFLETPDYINKIVAELMKEPKNTGYRDNDPDRSKPLFERVLRQEIRSLIENAVIDGLRKKYQPLVEAAVAAEMDQHEALEGSLAHAFGKVLAESWRINVETKFSFERERD